MADEDLITVTNNENPPINLEIISYINEVGVTYVQAKGDKGDIGETGDTGEKGDKGDVGVSTMFISSFTGSINGSNATFVLNNNYDDVIVFINGIKYAPTDYTYTKSSATVVFGFAIPSGYSLEFYGITNKSANVVPLEDLSTVATSGSYNSLTDKPTIPSNTSQLTNDSSFATTSQVSTAIQNVINSAPTALDTLKELADAINDDANFAGTVTTALSNKVDKVTGSRLITSAESTLIGNTSGTNSGDETTTTVGNLINGATAKTTPVDADMVGVMDSAASNILKKLSWANIKATLKTYFDTLYTLANLGGVATTTTINGKALSSNITVGSYSQQAYAAWIASVSASTTFYFGSYFGATITPNVGDVRIYAPKAGTITSAYVNFKQTTTSSAENSSLYIRVNNTTDYLISNTVKNNVGNTYISNASLNITVNVGDYWCFKYVTAAWGTLAGGQSIEGVIGIDL